MGGRGSSSGVPKPKYFAETEKAVKLKIGIDYYTLEKEKDYFVWVPKSQLSKDGRPGQWITNEKAESVTESGWGGGSFSYWEDASRNVFQPGRTRKEEQAFQARKRRFEAGKKSYEQLVQNAKSMGVKGVRIGMKRKTIERKIAEFNKGSGD